MEKVNVSATGELTLNKGKKTETTIKIEKTFKQSVLSFLETIGAKNSDNEKAVDKFASYMLMNVSGASDKVSNRDKKEGNYVSLRTEDKFKGLFFDALFQYLIVKLGVLEVQSDGSLDFKVYEEEKSDSENVA